jgi:hypothetical protein
VNSKPADSSTPREEHEIRDAEQDERRPSERERYGPLVISRRRKDDGRALLLFERSTQKPA